MNFVLKPRISVHFCRLSAHLTTFFNYILSLLQLLRLNIDMWLDAKFYSQSNKVHGFWHSSMQLIKLLVQLNYNSANGNSFISAFICALDLNVYGRNALLSMGLLTGISCVFLVLNLALALFLRFCGNIKCRGAIWEVAPHLAWLFAIMQLALQLFYKGFVTTRWVWKHI